MPRDNLAPYFLEMTSMSLDFGLLQTLHRMLRQLTDIEDRMRRGPMKVKVVESNETSFATDEAECLVRQEELRRSSNDKTMQLNEREAKIEDMKHKLNTCDSNKEFQLLKDRIAADLQANSVLQDEILELLERLDVVNEEVAQAKANHQKAKDETIAMREKVQLELSELEAEKARVTTELAEGEKGLPGAMTEDYRRLVRLKGENAFAISMIDTCDNCNQRLTTQTVSDLMLKKLVYCPGCGAVLYTKS